MNIPLNVDWQQILLHLFNFAILAGGLYFLLFKPVKDFMDKRLAYYQGMEKEAADKLEQAKMALGLDSLDSAAISDVKIDYTWSHLLPMDGITLEDANTLAECVQAMTGQELRVFHAVLEVEEPHSFHEAGTIAMDIDDYELVSGSEREYGREALLCAGADDEVLEMLDGFTDFDALGRSEMELDGVRESSYGPVKRLSAPWPEQTEQGQTMC